MAKRPYRKSASLGAIFRKKKGRFGFGFFFALSFALIVINTLNNPVLVQLRKEVTDISAPILITLSIPIDFMGRVIDNISDLANLRQENQRLRQENERLEEWRKLADLLELENARLREIAKVEVVRPDTLVTARVIAVAGGPFVRSVLLNVGSNQRVRKGLAVIDQKGVAGQTTEVGRRATRVLLLTDFNSRIPVRLARSKDNGILIGSNKDLLDLSFLPVNADVQTGDLVLTSGDGGLFPPGLVIGRVVVVESGKVKVRPAAELDKLEFVQVLDYSARELEPEPGGPGEKE
ncbi:MAG: rod shape-determining protein MreC [Sphingomonadales bacterium]